jgi:outer membrane protein TolC
VTQPIINVAAWHAYGTATENEKTARLSLDDVQRQIALGVANAIVGVVTAERLAELNRVGFRSALERLDLTRRRRALGAATGLDVVRAQQDVESARATLVTGDEALRQAREALGLALGLPRQIGVAKNINIDGLEQDAIRSCKPAPNLEQRSDIAAARQRVYVAERAHDNVKLQFLPILNAQSALGTTTQDTGALPATTWNIQAVLTVPLWEGGARYGRLRDTRAAEREAEMNLEALRRSASVQLEQARRNVEVTEQSRKVAADAQALAAEADRLVRTGYMAGQGTSLDLVLAAAALRQADITLALRDFDVVKARILVILSLATCPW